MSEATSNDKKMRVALFIPTYNSATQIVDVLDRVPAAFGQQVQAIYIFDNKSSDNTLEVLDKYIRNTGKNKICVFQNEKNYYLGGSTVLAFHQAIVDNIDYLICMHSDGQADPQFLTHFSEHLDQGYDFILGSRFLRNSQVGSYSKLRYLFNMIFVYLQWLILKQRVYDIGAFIGFKMSTIKRFPFKEITADMGYHPYLIMVVSKLSDQKIRFKEFPIHWGKVETSNINVMAYALIHLKRIIFLLFGQISKEAPIYRTQLVSGRSSSNIIEVIAE